ncbi:MAG: hypothetical protein AB1384_15510 [Actinomycetota bacterium]
MESAFDSLAHASATLLGLVLVALVFSYRSALSRLENIGEFRHFAKWVFAAGFTCFLYYGCCLLVGFRLSDDETSRTALIIITAFTTLALLIFHTLEIKWLLEMAREDWGDLKVVFIMNLLLSLVAFLVFAGLAWTALASSSLGRMEQLTFEAFTYALYVTSLRAVVMVGSAFWSLMVLSQPPDRAGSDEEAA